MPIEDDVKPGDILLGVPKIAPFIRELLGDETITDGQCYHWLEEQYIQNTKFGGQIVTTKNRVIAAFIPPAPARESEREVESGASQRLKYAIGATSTARKRMKSRSTNR
jgi:hypothetical protein